MWGEHIRAAALALDQLDAGDPCGLHVIAFADALEGARDREGALATRLLEPVVEILATWPAPTTPNDAEPGESELPDDLEAALFTADALRSVGALSALSALGLGPDSATGRAFAAAAVDLYAGRSSGLGWLSGAAGED